MSSPSSLKQTLAFNAQHVPPHAWDTHLPAVPDLALTAQALRQRFEQPPVWQPELRREPLWTAQKMRPAAVFIALVMRRQPTLILTQLSAQLSTHSGQIALPGGKIEPGESAEQAALREAHEEIGLQADFVQVLGALPPYVTGSAFHITPVVALVRTGFVLQTDPAEVDDVFEPPLTFLMNPAHHARHRWVFEGQEKQWFSMPWMDEKAGTERSIWGATAGILRNLYGFLSA